MFKKKIPYMILFLVLSWFSIRAILNQSQIASLEGIFLEIRKMNKICFFLAVVSASGFIIFEGLGLWVLIEGLSGKADKRSSMLYSAADIYFSAITPSASGGQPASAYFMIKDKIAPGKTTVILLINLIMYTYALFFCGIVTVLFHGDFLLQYGYGPLLLISFGMLVLLVLGYSFRLLLRKPEIVRGFLYAVIRIGEKLHIVKSSVYQIERADHMIVNYRECSEMVRGKSKMLLQCFAFNLLQRLSQCMVTVFCFMAMNGSSKRAFSVWCIHVYTAIGSNSVPIPGAIGVSDYLLVNGLALIPDIENPANLELFSRGLYFYVCIVLSLLIMVIAIICRRFKKIKNN